MNGGQAPPDRSGARKRAVCTVHWAVSALCVVALAWTVWQGVEQPWLAGAFGAFIAVGEAVRTMLPGERVTAPLGAAGALAYALLGEVEGVPTGHGVPQVAAVVAGATLAGLLPHAVLDRRPPDLNQISRRVLTAVFAATLFQPLRHSGGVWVATGDGSLFALCLIVILVLAVLCDAVLAAALTALGAGWRFAPVLRDELRALLGIGSAVCATGMVMALAAGVMGLWTLPVFGVPLLLTQFSFRRYAAIRATYRQTIASLARATEVAGYTRPGHVRRVMLLSRAVGRQLGMGERELLMLEYAALMHDIGQLSLVDPVPGGATATLPADQQRRIARLGGEVVRKTGVPDEVAVVVERQADPFRDRDGVRDPSHPLASRIVRAANAYDDLVGEGTGLAAGLQALERLRLCTAREFEPRVIEALAHVCLRGEPAFGRSAGKLR